MFALFLLLKIYKIIKIYMVSKKMSIIFLKNVQDNRSQKLWSVVYPSHPVRPSHTDQSERSLSTSCLKKGLICDSLHYTLWDLVILTNHRAQNDSTNHSQALFHCDWSNRWLNVQGGYIGVQRGNDGVQKGYIRFRGVISGSVGLSCFHTTCWPPPCRAGPAVKCVLVWYFQGLGS